MTYPITSLGDESIGDAEHALSQKSASFSHVTENQIRSLLDPRFLELVNTKDISQRNGQVTPKIKEVLGAALRPTKKNDIMVSMQDQKNMLHNKDIFLRMIDVLMKSAGQYERAKSQDYEIKKINVDASIKPIETEKKPEKKITIKTDILNKASTLRLLGLDYGVFFSTPLADLADYANAYQTHHEGMILLYRYTDDLVRHILLPAWNKLEKDLVAYSQQNKGDNKMIENEMYKRRNEFQHIIRDHCSNFLFPTEERPYALHPAYLFKKLNTYLPISKNDFSGIVAEARGDYCINGAETKKEHLRIKKYELTESDRSALDLHAKADDLYTYTAPNGDITWLAVDYKNQLDRQETKCMYDSKKLGRYQQYGDGYGYASNLKNILKAKGVSIKNTDRIRMMIAYVGRGGVYNTLFTKENVAERREQFLKTFLSA